MPFKQWLCLYPCKGYKVFRIICQPKFYVTEKVSKKILQLWQQQTLCYLSRQTTFYIFNIISHSIRWDPQYALWMNLHRSSVFCVQCLWEKWNRTIFILSFYTVKSHLHVLNCFKPEGPESHHSCVDLLPEVIATAPFQAL